MPEEARTKLNEMGHKFGSSPVDIGNVQSILIDRENGTFTGVADSSRNGAAIGVNLKNYKNNKTKASFLKLRNEAFVYSALYSDEVFQTLMMQAKAHRTSR